MPQFAWFFVVAAGFLCIGVEIVVRFLSARNSLDPAVQKEASQQKLLAIKKLTDQMPDAEDATVNGLLLGQVKNVVDDTTRATVMASADASPLFGLLNTVASKNILLGVGVILLLVPWLVSQGVSIDFNGSSTPAATSTPTPAG